MRQHVEFAMRCLSSILLLLTLSFGPVASGAESPSALELRKGDHIAIIGNALPDRMQHDGYLEALIHARFPDHDLVIRNLSAAGDEVVTRHRSENFGSPDDWLKRVQADVIFAFFGFNESFAGPEGLDKFKTDLGTFLKETAAKNYSGRGAPRVVLFSPTANERHQDPNFPDPAANNARIEMYSEAMKAVAREHGVLFIDLFHLSQELFQAASAKNQSLTINGIYLSEEGNRLLSPGIFTALFSETAPTGDLERLRKAIVERNEQWHDRYRTIDGYNVFGGRSALAYQAGKGGFISDRTPPEPYVSNFEVMQQEMAQRDVITANRDRRVWAVARGEDFIPDDSNLPPVRKVQTNKPGPSTNEAAVYLGGEEAISKMKVHSGMEVNLFASEETFPELINPVQMAWDTRGRLWVAVWPNYPERTPDSKTGDSLIILEDTNRDGKADKVTHFLDDLNAPTGFQFYKDGVLVMQAPDLWFVRDTNGDGKGDSIERVLMGMDSADSHHTANAICNDPGGAIYLSDGVFHRTQVETAEGPVRNNDAAIYRFEPRTGRFQTYISYGFANPHGRVFDYWGNDIVTDATGNANYFGPAFSGYIDYPAKHHGMQEFWARPSRPCPGTGILTSRHFPPEFQGNFLNLNVISFQGVFRVKVTEETSGLKGETMEDLISSSDPNFRPSAISVGPDGAIYFCDWHQSIIGHMQHHIRDPNRDHAHGRVYRITYKGRPLMEPVKIDGQPVAALLNLLKEPENQTRELAKIELGKHDASEVIPAVKSWISSLDRDDPAFEHHLLEGLWVHQWLNVADVDLLRRMLRSPEPRARAAAGRVLCYWRDRIPEPLIWFRTLANDENPRVRLEAVRGASFFRTPEAAEVALEVLRYPMDYYLEYTLKETLRQLDSHWRRAITSGQPIAASNPAGLKYLIDTINTSELLRLPHTPGVLQAILSRSEVPLADRASSLLELARLQRTSRVSLVLSLLAAQPGKAEAESASLARLLPLQLPEELKPARATLSTLATNVASAEVRRAAWAALAAADESFDSVWSVASRSPATLTDLLEGIPLLLDPDFRSEAYARVSPLLTSIPETLSRNQGLDANRVSELRRAAIRACASMNKHHETLFAALGTLITEGEQVPAVVQAMRVLPREAWPKAHIEPVATGLVAWAKSVPGARRTEEDFVQTIQFAGDLSGLLPTAKANELRRDLRDMRVAVFIVRTVREQMRFDTPQIVVEAGKPFELIVENQDFMPHNLVVVRPGTRETVGAAASTMRPDQVDNRGRAYLPRTDAVLAATRLLEPNQKETLKITAPETEGEYEYVCTFPGHAQVMWGWLIVTKDVDAYLQANPVSKPAGGGASAHDHHFE